MSEEDDILAFLDEGDAQLIEQMEEPADAKRMPALTSRRYHYALDESEWTALDLKQGTILDGVIYKRGGEAVDIDNEKVMFTVPEEGHDRILEDIMEAIAEQLDEITGRKMEKAGAEAWGMF